MPPGPLIAGVRTHRSTALAPGERGREFGRCQREAVRATATFYLRLLERDAGLGREDVVRFGAAVADALAPLADVVAEITGIAEGAGLPRSC